MCFLPYIYICIHTCQYLSTVLLEEVWRNSFHKRSIWALDMTLCWSGNCRGEIWCFLFVLAPVRALSFTCRLVSEMNGPVQTAKSTLYLACSPYTCLFVHYRATMGIKSPMTLMVCLKSVTQSIRRRCGAPGRRPQGKVTKCRNASWTHWHFCMCTFNPCKMFLVQQSTP